VPETEILNVGGSPAGLSTAGALKQIGIESVILNSSERIGQSWEQRYDCLYLHTVQAYSGLVHFPIPKTYPEYASVHQYASHLRD
jgi:cation diffusion facilitator CzcD-associated flavoprotein CzcO